MAEAIKFYTCKPEDYPTKPPKTAPFGVDDSLSLNVTEILSLLELGSLNIMMAAATELKFQLEKEGGRADELACASFLFQCCFKAKSITNPNFNGNVMLKF